MRKIVILAIAVAWPALAQDDQAEACKGLGDLAEQVMMIRQAEAPMSDVLASLVPPDDGSGATGIIRSVILAAYDEPAMRTPENKTQQVARFRNDVELQCFKTPAP